MIKLEILSFKILFFCNFFRFGKGLFNWHIIQSLHNTLTQIGAFVK